MSRYIITVTVQPLRSRRRDWIRSAAAHILPAGLPRRGGGDLALWVSTGARDYETIAACSSCHRLRLMPRLGDVALLLAADLAKETDRPAHDGPRAALLRHFQSQ